MNNQQTMFDRKIKYDLEHLNKEFRELLLEFSLGMQTEVIRGAIGKELSKQILTQEDRLTERMQKDFSLVLIGNFKRGKSTLVNALLGKHVVTTNVTPETVTINEISYGDRFEIEACLLSGGKVKLEPKQLHSERLIPTLEQLPKPVSHLNIKAPLPWLKGMRLIDTPGTADIFNRFDRQISDYLKKADAVIVVISALSPLSQSERAFLSLSVFPQDFPKLFFVLNALDFARSDREAERLLQSTTAKITSVFPQARVFGLSAYDEFCRLQSLDRPSPERSITLEKQFQMFREALGESILLNRDLIQLSRTTSEMEDSLRRWQSNLVLLRQVLQSDRVQLGKAIASCENRSSQLSVKIERHKQEIDKQMQQLLDRAEVWLDEFLERLETEAIAQIANFKIADLQRHYHFFLTDLLRMAIERCLDADRALALEIVEKETSSISKEIQALIEIEIAKESIGQFAIEQHWSLLDTVDWILHSFHLNFFVAPLIHLVKESGHSKESLHYQKQLQKTLPEIKKALTEQLQTLYNDLNKRMQEYVEVAYQQELENSLVALRQAEELCDRGEQTSNLTNRGLQDASVAIADTLNYLQKFQDKLSSNL
ncbi:MAG: dynamin family protein [Xenococcaceae cyanobacterium]